MYAFKGVFMGGVNTTHRLNGKGGSFIGGDVKAQILTWERARATGPIDL